MSIESNPFPATVRRPSASSREGSPAPMEVKHIERAEAASGDLWRITVTKVRPYWVEMIEDAGYRIGTIYPNTAGTVTVSVRPDE